MGQKEEWDEKGRNAIGIRWGHYFAEETKAILVALQNGSEDALSVWMENERQRILPEAVSYTHLTLPTICSV